MSDLNTYTSYLDKKQELANATQTWETLESQIQSKWEMEKFGDEMKNALYSIFRFLPWIQANELTLQQETQASIQGIQQELATLRSSLPKTIDAPEDQLDEIKARSWEIYTNIDSACELWTKLLESLSTAKKKVNRGKFSEIAEIAKRSLPDNTTGAILWPLADIASAYISQQGTQASNDADRFLELFNTYMITISTQIVELDQALYTYTNQATPTPHIQTVSDNTNTRASTITERADTLYGLFGGNNKKIKALTSLSSFWSQHSLSKDTAEQAQQITQTIQALKNIQPDVSPTAIEADIQRRNKLLEAYEKQNLNDLLWSAQ